MLSKIQNTNGVQVLNEITSCSIASFSLLSPSSHEYSHFFANYPIMLVYVNYKNKMEEFIARYDKLRRSGARLQVENIVNILKGEAEDRFDKVFESTSHLLPGFLAAAEDRRVNGVVEVRKPRAGKRKRDDTTTQEVDDAEEEDEESDSDEEEEDEDDDNDEHDEVDNQACAYPNDHYAAWSQHGH